MPSPQYSTQTATVTTRVHTDTRPQRAPPHDVSTPPVAPAVPGPTLRVRLPLGWRSRRRDRRAGRWCIVSASPTAPVVHCGWVACAGLAASGAGTRPRVASAVPRAPRNTHLSRRLGRPPRATGMRASRRRATRLARRLPRRPRAPPTAAVHESSALEAEKFGESDWSTAARSAAPHPALRPSRHVVADEGLGASKF